MIVGVEVMLGWGDSGDGGDSVDGVIVWMG